MARKKKNSNGTTMVTIRFPNDLLARVDETRIEAHRKRTEQITYLVQKALQREG